MFDRRNNLSDLVAADARGFFGDQVYETAIPRNIRVSEAPSHGKPVLLYDNRSAGAQAYLKLAEELLARERGISGSSAMSAAKDNGRLGRGLAALLGEGASPDPIEPWGPHRTSRHPRSPGPFQPRAPIDAAAIADLTDSVRSPRDSSTPPGETGSTAARELSDHCRGTTLAGRPSSRVDTKCRSWSANSAMGTQWPLHWWRTCSASI